MTGEVAALLGEKEFALACRLIGEYAGIKLSPHKRYMVHNRLSRRLRERGLDSFSDYLHLVQNGQSGEREAFVNALTTNLTSFFREAYHFGDLATQLREAAARTGTRTPLRIWCSAASTGEEPWSLAITACEAFGTLTPPVHILATDIDTSVLETAEEGVYAMDRIASLSEKRRQAFFQRGSGPHSGQCRVRPALRALVEFRPLNLLDRSYGIAPGLTAIFCRNVMIYFDKPTQFAVLQRMIPLLAPEGRLYAGHSESFTHAADLVTSCGRTVYRARERA